MIAHYRTASVDVRPLAPAAADAWERFVLAQASATVFHRLAWSRAVERAYPHRPMHLVAWRDRQVVGVLPLFLVRSLLAGRVLVSVPYATYGGIVAADDEARDALLQAAETVAGEQDVEYLELRHRDPNALPLPEIGRYDTFRKELPATVEEVLASLPRKARAAARKGIRELGEEAAAFGHEHLEAIYDLYAVNLRRLGSPNYRRSLFFALCEEYGEDCICTLVRHQGRPVAGVVSFRFRDELVPYFSGALPAAQALCANNLMYLRLMEYGVRHGLRWFDFNRTRRDNSGPYDFKRHHGFEPSPLHYQVHLNRAREIPNLSPDNRRYHVAARVWQHLPLWLTRTAGSKVTQWIP